MNGHKNGDPPPGKNGPERRFNFGTQTPWETQVGYSRAVRCGNLVFVAGTTASNEKGEIASPDNAKDQALHTFRNLERALRAAVANLKDVVQTRMYVVDIDSWEAVGQAHAEFFKDIRPAATLVEVSSLVHPDMLVEIEAVAVLTEAQPNGQSAH